MAASQGGQTPFNAAQKLDILRRMTPHLQQCLIPSALVPRMGTLLTREQRSSIIEAEQRRSRSEAAGLLINHVITAGEHGLNIFLHALRGDEAGDDPGWERILRLLGESSVEDINRHPNEYYTFLVHLLEGDIIDKLTEGLLAKILQHLLAAEVIASYEVEIVETILRGMGRYHAAMQMFTLLGMRTSDWPLGFFRALQAEAPELLHKMIPYDVDPIVEKEVEESMEKGDDPRPGPGPGPGGPGGRGGDPDDDEGGNRDSDEQTERKQLFIRGGQQGGYGEQEFQGSGSGVEETITKLQMEVRAVERFAVVGKGDPDSSSGDEGIADVDESGFSDNEKQEDEGMEKREGDGRGEPVARTLQLRNYQRELAQHALQGVNTIICAPTGSGKTRVALHIVMEHLKAREKDLTRPKVVFMARTLPLVTQQWRNFRDYLPQYRCELVTGDSENSMTVHHRLDEVDILVLTPKILENHLRPDKIPSLSAFSLLIFDECHHTRKGEPYMSVMKHYLQFKQRGHRGLPQIVGLTASIGVEKATTAEEAKESLLSIMANLDVKIISEVIENQDELLDKVPIPDEDLMNLMPRELDEVSRALSNVMHKIVEELERREQYVKDDRQLNELRTLLHKHETDFKSQKFGQWAVMLRNTAKLQPKTPKDARDTAIIMRRQAFCWEVQVLADWLVAYNEAFDVHDLTRPEDVLSYLERKSELLCEKSDKFLSTELDQKLQEYFKDVSQQLKRFKVNKNPNLELLGRTVMEHIEKSGAESDSFRILVFVRTRATCQALSKWMNSAEVDRQLRDLKAEYFTGTGAKGTLGGMTPYGQVEALKKFNDGTVKLLVTTSVGEEGIDIADCNLTIRYNHVGNEVTTVQTRGRSRKRGGRSILMAMPKIIEQEALNRKRMELMYQALNLLRGMPQDKVNDFIKKVQDKVLEAEEIDQLMKDARKQKRKESEFSVACPQCHKVRVNGSEIRKINNAHHVIIGHDIDSQVVIMPGRTFLTKDDWEMHGSVVCKCKAKLGQLLLYKKAQFIMVSPKQWVFLDKNDMPSSFKQWSKVPYQVEEVTPRDIKKHLNWGSDDDDEEEEEGAVGGV